MAENYQKQLDSLIDSLSKEGKRKKLLLHVCCAPCASYVLEYLTKYFDITVFFFNPNIYPDAEYIKRRDELVKLLSVLPGCEGVALSEEPLDPDEFYDAVKGLEEQREGGSRCEACIRLRLDKAAGKAAAGGFDYMCTTLSISPHKNAAMINRLGAELAKEYGIEFLPSDFKKREGYKRSVELCSQYDIYRQSYCGCRYSLPSC